MEEAPAGESVPIGKPIANTRVYVLDQHSNPVPVGVAGELFAVVTAWRAATEPRELTSRKFVTDPFSRESGARMYATGDRVRYRRDGKLEFLGRSDNQVKIRGFRVEVDEIECMLRTHPAVRDAACALREDTPGDKRIAAYVVMRERDTGTAELRRFLEERFPEYLVPAAMVMLEALPVTVNGKVDRAALPAPGDGRPQLEATYVAPQTDTERMVAALWQEVLGIQNASIHDNFFDLGGHSLLVVLLHNRLKEAFQRELSIVDLFRYPTVASLARLLAPEEARAHA